MSKCDGQALIKTLMYRIAGFVCEVVQIMQDVISSQKLILCT